MRLLGDGERGAAARVLLRGDALNLQAQKPLVRLQLAHAHLPQNFLAVPLLGHEAHATGDAGYAPWYARGDAGEAGEAVEPAPGGVLNEPGV